MEEKEDIFKDGLKGGYHKHVKEIHIDKIIKKIYKPFLILIVILVLFFWGYFTREVPVCETCQVCEELSPCPELDYSKCPKEIEKITTIRYACSNGLIVDNLDECNPLNYVTITSPYKETKNAVTFSIDKISYETVGSYSKITKIDYTILNMREHEIKPIILVNIYAVTDERSEQGYVHEVFDDEEYIGSNAWVIKKKKTNIGFRGTDIIIRLVLKDTLMDPDKELVRVSRPLSII